MLLGGNVVSPNSNWVHNSKVNNNYYLTQCDYLPHKNPKTPDVGFVSKEAEVQ